MGKGRRYRYDVYEDTVEKENVRTNGSNGKRDEVAGDDRLAKRQKR
jgi:hypothetical protein